MILIAITGIAAPFAAHSQPAIKAPRIGYLGLESLPSTFLEAFVPVSVAGATEGRNITIETRFADGSAERLAVVASELAGLKPDVIVAISGPVAQAHGKRVRFRSSSA